MRFTSRSISPVSTWIGRGSGKGKVVIVFEADEDDGYNNVYCYTLDFQLLWRIKPVPVAIGGTDRSPDVGVDILDGNCRVVIV